MVIAFNRLPDDKKVESKGGMNRIVPLYVHVSESTMHVLFTLIVGFLYRMTEKLRELVLEIESTHDLE